MRLSTTKWITAALLGSVLALPITAVPVLAQNATQAEHDRARAEQNAYDKQHHNTAKVVGGSAAGGALVGGLLGGGKGALIGAGVGAGGGYVGDHIRKSKGTTKRVRLNRERRSHHHHYSH